MVAERICLRDPENAQNNIFRGLIFFLEGGPSDLQGDVSNPLEGLPTRSQLLTLPMVVVALTAANTGTQENHVSMF